MLATGVAVCHDGVMHRHETFRDDGRGLVVFTSDLWQTNSVVLECGDGLMVFDPTYFPREIDAIHQYAAAAPGRERLCVFTHGDWDHIVGFPVFADWETLGHPAVASADEATKRKTLAEIADLDARWYVPRPAEALTYPRIDKPVKDKAVLGVSGEPVRFYHVPGHTDDGIAAVFERKQLLIAGDYLSELEFPFVNHSLGAYRKTLERFKRLIDRYHIDLVAGGHGPPAVGKPEIERRLKRDLAYLDALAQQVTQHTRDGLRDERLQAALAGMLFDGQPIPASQQAFHRENVVQTQSELHDMRHEGRS
jgi:glyoxylase-like metal-dependent hydrolase (beta-lactamase superfamily II)